MAKVYCRTIVERAFYYDAPPEIRKIAQKLRRRMTEGEKLLWQELRHKRAGGAIFRRQHAIGRYIADFYCHAAKLVLEVDGRIHDKPEVKEADENRTAELERLGIRVIRFSNDEIFQNLNEVITRIRTELEQRLSR